MSGSVSAARSVLFVVAWILIILQGAFILHGSLEFERGAIGILVLLPVVLKTRW